MPERAAVEEFMAELYERARQDGESPERVAERVYENVRGVSRRELLRGGSALGAGAAIGGGGGYAMSQPGAAQEDDDDGNVGTPDDPVDVYADLLSTGSALIGSNDIVEAVETGTASVPAPSAASADGFDNVQTASTTVSFDTSFDSAPDVALGNVYAVSGGALIGQVFVVPGTVTATGFDVVNINGSTSAGTSLDVDYVAVQTS